MMLAAGSRENYLHDVILEILSASLNFITSLPCLPTCWATLDKDCNTPRPLFTH